MIRFSERRAANERDAGSWELSFADMMTLILCFFILVVAVSEVDSRQYSQVAESLGDAMNVRKPANATKAEDVPESVRIRIRTLAQIEKDLAQRIGHERDAVDIEKRPDAVAVNLHGAVFFDLGSAELTPRALATLDHILPALQGVPYRLTVEGHTDDIPIQSEIFPSNWELSAARASAVARHLIDKGFPPEQIQVKGLADTRPKFANRDAFGNPIPENQARNRRIVLLVEP
ncbi:chemotaxis protein MotB [Desulfobaculum xiamenense]|uniref:Chemotaxis protein MotB n=1 Tax=Desulfobaculum xiamenense TaxID=995050 RepID=A0A846QR40_9BACT|nr:flagellar motor protein MotB [Desulfobaculum xiamenense]NJB67855.1 chemotaxis protein MotB [Desulfobaculum xiamenense]